MVKMGLWVGCNTNNPEGFEGSFEGRFGFWFCEKRLFFVKAVEGMTPLFIELGLLTEWARNRWHG